MWLIKKWRKNRYQGSGFTLIELMVAASIVGLIGLVILATFGSGFHVYERIQSYGGIQTDVLLSLEEIEKSLRNIFPFSAIGFQGDTHRIAFPSLVETVETLDGEDAIVLSVGKKVYYLDDYDNDTKVLRSEQQNYARAIASVNMGEESNNILVFVKDIKFSYYFLDIENNIYVWEDSWSIEKEGLPAGVKIELTFQDGNRDVQMVRTVLIPTVQEAEEEDEGGGGEGEG